MTDHGIAPVHALEEPVIEALVETMFLAAYADGEFSDVERADFARSVESLTDRRVSEPAAAALLARIEALVQTEGREARLTAVKAALPAVAARKVALSLAIRVMAADGILRTAEREAIHEMAEALGIDADTAADLVVKLGV